MADRRGSKSDPADAASARAELGAGHTIIEGDAADRAVLAQGARGCRELAPLGGWVNNVGIAIMSNLHEPNPAEVERLISVNLMSHYWGCSEAISDLGAPQGGGRDRQHFIGPCPRGLQHVGLLRCRQGGIDALTRYIAVEYGPIGIRANSIQPGATATPLVKQVIADSPDPKVAAPGNVDHPSARTHLRTGRGCGRGGLAAVVGSKLRIGPASRGRRRPDRALLPLRTRREAASSVIAE